MLRTSRPFTEGPIKALLVVAMAAALTACVSLGDRGPASAGQAADVSAKSSTSGDPSDQNGRNVGAPVNSELTSMPRPTDAPEVRRHNAEAFAQAVELMRDDRMRDAEILLVEITSDQPELAGPWINLGEVYVALEQPEEARRAFEAAVRANPWNCTAHNELGVLSRRYGDFAGAEQHYLACLERVPEFKDAHLNLGILYELYLGRLSEALESYRRYQALSSEPDRRVQGWVMDLERRLGV